MYYSLCLQHNLHTHHYILCTLHMVHVFFLVSNILCTIQTSTDSRKRLIKVRLCEAYVIVLR